MRVEINTLKDTVVLLSDENHKEKLMKGMKDNLRKDICNLQNKKNKRAEKIWLLEAELDVSESDESMTEQGV